VTGYRQTPVSAAHCRAASGFEGEAFLLPFFVEVKAKKVTQSRYRPGVAQRVPGS